MSNHSLTSNKFKLFPFLLSMAMVTLITYAFMKIGSIYNSYKIDKIVDNPVYLKAIITKKHTYKRSSFDIKYLYRDKLFSESIVIDAKNLKSFQKGDTISVAICKTAPSLVVTTSELSSAKAVPSLGCKAGFTRRKSKM